MRYNWHILLYAQPNPNRLQLSTSTCAVLHTHNDTHCALIYIDTPSHNTHTAHVSSRYSYIFLPFLHCAKFEQLLPLLMLFVERKTSAQKCVDTISNTLFCPAAGMRVYWCVYVTHCMCVCWTFQQQQQQQQFVPYANFFTLSVCPANCLRAPLSVPLSISPSLSLSLSSLSARLSVCLSVLLPDNS